MDAESKPHRRPPLGALVALVLVLAGGPIGFAVLPRHDAPPRRGPDIRLADIAARAGCRVVEYDTLRPTNPPVGGRISNESFIAHDGSYVHRTPPSERGSLHSLMHGRVLIRFSRDLPEAQLRALDLFTRRDSDQVVTFADTIGLRSPVVATAWLSMMTCPAVTPRTLAALGAFRDRRRGFGQTL
jgi:hypothetical protein